MGTLRKIPNKFTIKNKPSKRKIDKEKAKEFRKKWFQNTFYKGK